MAEYIEREAFLDYMKGTSRYFNVQFDIENFPAADVAPAIHAHWAQTSKGVIYCSNCGAVCGIGAHIEEVTEDHYFCYYCGARMDGGDTNA